MNWFRSRSRTVSHYRLGELIGSGSMGAVYRATDTHSNRLVAIKLLHEHLSDDPTFRERFRREAQYGSLLASPFTTRLLDYGEERGTHFLVMELVEGMTIQEMLAKGPLPASQALELARQVALSLDEAHNESLIHRDIKPENLRVAADGHVKVLDFGITRRLEGDTLTKTGSFVGTVAYAAPETFLAEREATDQRCDLYSLGATLFHMLAGERPFSGDTVSLIRQHQESAPPLERLAHLPDEAIEVVRRSLEKNPNDRYPSAVEMAAGLAVAARAVAAAGRNRYDYIKVYNSLTTAQFDAIIEEAGNQGIRVIGHGVREPGLGYILESGQVLVAHAEEYLYSFFDFQDDRSRIQEAVDLTRETGAYLIPNLSAYEIMAI